MSYSIVPILHHREDKNKLHKIVIQVIYNRKKAYVSTDFKVLQSQFDKGNIINHPNKDKINKLLKQQIHEVEGKILDLKSPDELNTINNPRTGYVADFVDKIHVLYKGRLSEGRLKHYNAALDKMLKYTFDLRFDQITPEWMKGLEAFIRTQVKEPNTVQSNMKVVKSILNKASEHKLITIDKFKYSPPKYIQKIPEYLTQEEIDKFLCFVKTIEQETFKRAGFYFVLGCYTGFRMSDLINFNYQEKVKGNKIIIRAAKNDRIVSIPVYQKLSEVLELIKDAPLNLSEGKFREYVKELAKLCGISRKIKIHTARHSFAMLLLEKGFTIDEVGELIGDTKEVTKIYARITNKHLENKFNEKFQ